MRLGFASQWWGRAKGAQLYVRSVCVDLHVWEERLCGINLRCVKTSADRQHLNPRHINSECCSFGNLKDVDMCATG